MEIKLIIVGGKTKKTHVNLTVPATIGRSRQASLTVVHPMVSRRHCELFEADGLLRVRDLGSLNGTHIGGKPIAEAPLRPNDRFSIGPLEFCVDYDYAGEMTAEAPGSASEGEMMIPSDDGIAILPLEESPAAGSPGPEASAPDLNLAPPDGQVPDFTAWEQRAAQIEPPSPEVQPAAPAAAGNETPAPAPAPPPIPPEEPPVSPPPERQSDAAPANALESFFNSIQ